MTRKVEHLLYDILKAIERVEEITTGRTLEDFEASWQLQWLVQRAIEIVSEASRAIPDELTNVRPEIEWRKSARDWQCAAARLRGSVGSHNLERGP